MPLSLGIAVQDQGIEEDHDRGIDGGRDPGQDRDQFRETGVMIKQG